mmetsp:Transcript_7031/g.7143  ORF Transcript_7031/g.7143 Transcript_7031/m.7143 type:complete len:311 (-) Transcript_7031:578-1510(-)|eukprot:CAMPEP_0119037808 /NCGR_PEP_ID=MMETSP1177-20130426/6323_1 /TAXON_ID=2985 /ORGANISM="Ochromonas sp, Strain CCMP1899" /LENGTH=310 /DNA_ID=CAMNT_0006999517 /DNA_START=58 /DNA_END=990 /DNA_ORIENTATION=+
MIVSVIQILVITLGFNQIDGYFLKTNNKFTIQRSNKFIFHSKETSNQKDEETVENTNFDNSDSILPVRLYANSSKTTKNVVNVAATALTALLGFQPQENIPDSPQELGFLPLEYELKGDSSTKFKVCQVPGDGDCLFYSLAVCIRSLEEKDNLPSFDGQLSELSSSLRKISVEVLSDSKRSLYTEGIERNSATELVEMGIRGLAAYGGYGQMSRSEYLQQMLLPNTWGGGPEIVALSNYYERPVHVYELLTDGFFFKKFQLNVVAKFGSPKFDLKSPLQILCADGRFPFISPGQQKSIGDHFLALYPSST